MRIIFDQVSGGKEAQSSSRNREINDLVGLAVFLVSEASSLITGQNMFVDGGVTATQ